MYPKIVWFCFFSVTFMLGAQPALHAEPQLSIALSRQQIPLDSTSELILEFQWPDEEGTYQFALPVPELQNLELVRRGESQEASRQAGKVWHRKMFTYVLKPRQAGKARVETFNVGYVNAQTGVTGEMVVPAHTVLIERPFVGSMFFWGLMILLGGFAGLLLLFLSRALRNARTQPRQAGHRQYESLEERKLRELRFQAADNIMPHPERVPVILNRIFRTYLTEKYGIEEKNGDDAVFLARLCEKGTFTPEERKKVEALLQELREAKYSGIVMEAQNLDRLTGKIVQYISDRKVVGSPGA